MENILAITVRSTHYYLIDLGQGKLLVDAGWVGYLAQFANRLKAYQLDFSDIHYIMFTHHHPDHAGLVQTVKRLSGAKLIIHEKQIPYLAQLAAYFQNNREFEPVVVNTDDLASPDRNKLAEIGIKGEIVETPGHSDDSISLVLDSGAAFVGDLTPLGLASDEKRPELLSSWKKLVERKVHTVYHAHADPFPITDIVELF
jgi:glyoxylase-like metal-dependent hydrolase (beta-lactamase superfamily II)